MNTGIYEALITASLREKLNSLQKDTYYLNEVQLDKEEAIRTLSFHLQEVISRAFQQVAKKDLILEKQIEISNRLIQFLNREISQYNFEPDLIDGNGRILMAVFHKMDSHYSNLDLRLKEITPTTRLTQSELFTGGNLGLSLDTELKKEIRSSNRVDLLVSFIKWKAIVILKEAFKEFTSNGGKLRVITTTYMGATDSKAIQELAQLPNTEIKVSYNTQNERLHAKAYLFHRDSGFHTGYIGSSNFSRSALTDGLEWNVKITTKEIPHIIDKFQKTFETYWQNPEFETYDPTKHFEKLSETLSHNKIGRIDSQVLNFFDLKPYHYQKEILSKLQVERQTHGRYRNLVVAATGTGKTMISAFDFKRFKSENPNARLLFIAHRIEILRQALHTFRNILKDQNFGELLGDGYQPIYNENVFATIQSLTNKIKNNELSSTYYDYIVFDEVHHAEASSYQRVMQWMQPTILLGLTATPERADGKSILSNFDNQIAAEIRLPDALNNKLLTPFQYFALSDSVDLEHIKWVRGKYDPVELTKIYTSNDQRVRDIIDNLNKYCKDLHDLTALGFCISVEHAKFMQQKFEIAGLKAGVLTSSNSQDRIEILNAFKTKEINYLFVVDMFNEGVDIPQVDTVLFLRPTESLTIFLQQLGRGLRLYDGKESLTVLDFVGNANENYDFESKFRALIGKTTTSVQKEIENDFMHLPLGCSIVLEKKAKEVILANIKKATSLRKKDLVRRLEQYVNQTNLPLTLSNFVTLNHLPFQRLYLRFSWTALQAAAGIKKEYDPSFENNYVRLLGKKWAATNSISYFRFLLDLVQKNFEIDETQLSELDRLRLTMLHFDFWEADKAPTNLLDSLKVIGQNKDYVEEMKAYLELRISLIDFEEYPCENLNYELPLELHARYTRDQILAAFRISNVEKRSSNREGVALNKALNTEVLFINLQKSERDFSPTTMYEDYAINETKFHWQSQNTVSESTPKGQSYINQQELDKKILLFVRESNKDEFGLTSGYVFVGLGDFLKHEGSYPMSITWELQKPIPEFLWTASAKMAIG
ncbi:DEAD/DEAH box helicase [Chryseobacterium sp. A321]